MLLTTVLLSASSLLAFQCPAGFNCDDESKVGAYTLPDPLAFSDGTPVKSAKQWPERRTQIFKLFESQVYGKSPGRPADMTFEVFEQSENAVNGTASRKQIAVYFDKQKTVRMDVLVYLPKQTKRPVPVFLGINFNGNQAVYNDPAIRITPSWLRDNPTRGVVKNHATEASRGTNASQWQLEKILAAGYGLATIYYGDIDPDFDSFDNGVHPLYYKSGQTRPADDEWGAIAAWGWGASRALDYLETDKAIDSKRVALIGHSRLGKAALWAGARDMRFAALISNESGEGGAAIARRAYGETTKRINTAFPHWFCTNFKRYNDKEAEMPVDQHMLIALLAPRPVYIASAVEDQWSDPRGEFLSGKHATPVYKLLGVEGLAADQFPGLHEPVLSRISYHIRGGKHDVTDYDWEQYLKFADRFLKAQVSGQK
jgi:hypothetical protein